MAAIVRVQKTKDYTVMANYHLRDKNLSLKAKGLLSYMLSLPDNWDYSIKGLETTLKEGREAIRAALKELEKFGYLNRKRLRDENNRLLPGCEYIIYEKPETDFLSPDPQKEKKPKSGFPTQAHTEVSKQDMAEKQEPKSGFLIQDTKISVEPNTGFPTQAFPTWEKSPQISTYLNKELKERNTQFIHQADTVEIYEEDEIEDILREQIEYDVLIQDPDYFGGTSGTELLDSIVAVLQEPFISNKPIYRIGGTDIATEAVRSRIRKLECEHVKYVYDCVFALPEGTSKIKNIKAYLLTALYNAPVTYAAYCAEQSKSAGAGR